MRCTNSSSCLNIEQLIAEHVTLHVCCQEAQAGHDSPSTAILWALPFACGAHDFEVLALQLSYRQIKAHQSSVRSMALKTLAIAPIFLVLRWEHGALPQAFTAGCPLLSCLMPPTQLSLLRLRLDSVVKREHMPGRRCPSRTHQQDVRPEPASHTLCLREVLMRSRLRCRFFAGTRRRAKALEHLPGPTPKYWLPGFMGLIVSRQPHRYATMLAEKFGPIFKFRVLWYHVSF